MSITGTSASPDREVDGLKETGASPTVSGSDGAPDPVVRFDDAAAGGQHLDVGPVVRRYPSPVGELVLIAGPSGLAAVLWPDDDRPVRVRSGLDARSLVAGHTANRLGVGDATGGEPASTNSGAAPAGGAGAARRTAAGDVAPARGAAPAGATAAVGDVAPGRDVSSAREATAVWALLDETARQLDEYFAGSRFAFDLLLDPVGTEFQVTVWRSLADIGYGETSTYGEQAARIGRPTAVRAVGAANGRNPLSIVVPCHRVVGSDGRLTGFAGGLEAKTYLLEHEARHRRR